ncbi:MAG: hypothetical protein RLZZ628_1910 [Bacteroidota bacterium]|jgi:hypothetical protein
MKKMFIVIYLITSILNNTFAQIQKGSWMIDGNLYITQHPLNGGGDYQFQSDASNADAAVGYFFSDRLVVGAKVGAKFNNRTSFWGTSSISTSQIFYVTPYTRYYFTQKSKLKTFYEFNARSSWLQGKSNLNWTAQNYFSIEISHKIGVDYFLTQNLALEAASNYLYYAAKTSFAPYSFPKFVFSPEFSIKLFLNTEKQDAPVLAEKYLKKGNMTFGLTGDLNDNDYNYAHLNPYIGYFLTDKWMISSSLRIDVGEGYRYFSLLPELRYYHPITPSMQFLLRGMAEMSSYYDNGQTSWGGNGIEAGLGLNQFVSEHISIQATANLAATSNYWNQLLLSPNVKVGFQYFMK